MIRLRDNFFGSDAGTVSGFFVLRKDINYLKADTGNGIPANGNSFSLTGLTSVQAGNGDNASMYCIQAGKKYYFGVRDETSNKDTLVPKTQGYRFRKILSLF